MPCTTLLVGKKASNDGSTMIARTDDGFFDVKKTIVVEPKDQKRKYKSVLSHLEIELPDHPLRYTACPNVDPKEGVWAATGINAANVGMTATETITSNPRVLAADPLVEYKKAKSRREKDIPGGIVEMTDEISAEIEQYLENQSMNSIYAEALEGWRSEHEIVYDYDAIALLTAQAAPEEESEQAE